MQQLYAPHRSKALLDKSTEVGEGNGLQFASSAMQGWRQSMEDECVVLPRIDRLPGHSLVAVFDGHGGAATAQVAARILVPTLLAQPEIEQYAGCAAADPHLLEAALKAGLLAMDAALPAMLLGEHGDKSSGSTATVVLITPTHCVCASVGDSRAVLCRPTSVTALSHDHKPSDGPEAARIAAAGGLVAFGRVGGNLAMSRALGDFEFKRNSALPAERQMVTAEPTIVTAVRDHCAGEYIIVACDGLWDTSSNTDCCCRLRELIKEGSDEWFSKDAGSRAEVLGMVAEELLDESFDRGSTDNISAVLVALPAANGVPQSPPMLGRSPLRERRQARLVARHEKVARENAEELKARQSVREELRTRCESAREALACAQVESTPAGGGIAGIAAIVHSQSEGHVHLFMPTAEVTSSEHTHELDGGGWADL